MMHADPRRFKNRIYGQFARVGKALASPRRLELLDLLCQGERTVEELARQASLTTANTSQHLKVLREARLVEAEKRGMYVVYRLADEAVCDFYRALRNLAELRLTEVDAVVEEFFGSREGMEPVDRRALLARARVGEVTVLDVRPEEEYRAGHLPGAVSLPLGQLEARLSELSRDRKIVAYCRGPYCVLAAEAVEVLRAHGFRAERLEDGVWEWRARGLPVEVDEAP